MLKYFFKYFKILFQAIWCKSLVFKIQTVVALQMIVLLLDVTRLLNNKHYDGFALERYCWVPWGMLEYVATAGSFQGHKGLRAGRGGGNEAHSGGRGRGWATAPELERSDERKGRDGWMEYMRLDSKRAWSETAGNLGKEQESDRWTAHVTLDGEHRHDGEVSWGRKGWVNDVCDARDSWVLKCARVQSERVASTFLPQYAWWQGLCISQPDSFIFCSLLHLTNVWSTANQRTS